MCQMTFFDFQESSRAAQSDAKSLDKQLVTALLRGMLNAAI